MAIFSKKTEVDIAQTDSQPAALVNISGQSARKALIIPRISEKSTRLSENNKYVFKVQGKANKIEVRKAIESQYGAQVARVNIVSMKGKSRRYGKTVGRTSDFKKAIVTLKPGSKKIDLATE